MSTIAVPVPPSAGTSAVSARWLKGLVWLWIVLAFTDEIARRASDSASVIITAPKDIVLLVAAFLAFPRLRPARALLMLSPWFLVAVLGCLRSSIDGGGPLFLVACLRTYVLVPIAATVVAADFAANRRNLAVAGRLWGVLLVGAAGVSLVQDMDRAALPAVLSKRLYMEGNSLAYAPYNESVFATPQTLAVIAFVTFAHAWTLLISRRRQPLPGTVFLLGLVIVAAGAAYLSRIRTSLVLGAFYAVLSVTLRVRWRGAFIAAALVLVAYAAKVEIPGVGQLFEEDRTTRYYTMAFESQELMTRTRGPIDEAYAYHAYSPSILGDGGGNSGALRGLRDSPPWFVPVTNDTGYFLILVEFGLLGVVLLGAALLAVGVRGFTRPPPWLPDIGLAYAMLLVWFSMKSATILTNGVAETMLFAHLGACYAGVGGEEGAWRTRPRSPSRLSVRG